MGSDRVNSTGSEAWQVLPFANALTAATAVFSVALRAVRDLFTVVFNSQFLGANVASLSPHSLESARLSGPFWSW